MLDIEGEIITDIDMGPLEGLLGIWMGDKGRDISPEPDGVEDNSYYERIQFSLTRRVSNAEEQKLAAVQYRQLVRRTTNNKVLHDQCGYWAWDAESEVLMHVFTIPRGVAVIAGGGVSENEDGNLVFEVSARAGDAEWAITEAPFMQKKARTLSFSQKMILGQGNLSYEQSTLLDIYGKEFEHTENNDLSLKS